MSSNQEKILNFYSGGGEDGRSQKSRSVEMEFHYTKKIMNKYLKPDSHIIELGCGTGYYGMLFADKCATYTGVDMSPDNIAVFESKIAGEQKNNIFVFVGDATNLCGIEDDGFDIVMCLGPMYHLPREERMKVFEECLRIAHTGAIIAFAYINRLGIYAGACVVDNNYPNIETNKLVFEHNTGDIQTGVFLFTSPEEMEYDAKQNGLEVIENCGLDFFFASSAIDKMSDEQFELFMEITDKMSESNSCTGLSNHALLICRK